MKSLPRNFYLLIRRIGLLLFIYLLCRLLFLLFNRSAFLSTDTFTLFKTFFFGLRYDITAIVISNIFFISLHLFPFRIFYTKLYQRILKVFFYVINIPLLLLSCVDFGLFRFTGKRSGYETINIMSYGNDFINTLPSMIKDFWYLLLIFFFIIYMIKKFYAEADEIKSQKTNFFHSTFGKIILFILFLTLTFIGFRGGIQYRPLNILSASRYGTGQTATLVLNTPFTVIKTYGKQTIQEVHWMTDEAAEKLSPVIKKPGSGKSFRSENVIIIILESFGKEYVGSLNSYKGYTPFLDSLIGKSLVFPNGFANGKRSIEGVPAIVAGIPALISDPFITSAYSGNTITTIPSLLKLKGYSTQFFHGGTNGTMGFDNFSKLAGFDKYFGRNEYNNDDDFDGSWGIYDEPFLQRMVTEVSKMKPPFLATVFTLSSHHPYEIPEKYVKKFPEGTLPIHQSIQYADYSLKKFFETASAMPWFKNTLFVLMGDHTAISEKTFYNNHVGMYSLPLIFFSSSDSLLKGISIKTTQQIDILPSVMDYLGYDHDYFAFGNSVFRNSGDEYAINYVDETYQLIIGNYSLIFNGNIKSSFYNFAADSTLKNNLVEKGGDMEKKMEMKLKSVIQNFNHAMIHNEMK